MSSRWIKWFTDEDQNEAGEQYVIALSEAHECLKCVESPWFKRFIERLAEESMRPGPIGNHADMIAGVSRANTYKELRLSLLDEIAKARTFIESSKES